MKIDKEFCLSDNSVNVYGYRLLTEGLQLDRFNPAIGYLMHDRQAGVAVRWEDLAVRDGKVYGKPVVNDTQYPGLATSIQEGFYAAASVGHIVAIEQREPTIEELAAGQTGPTVTKWFPREVSIVDIPGNYNAVSLGRLYDENDAILADLSAKLNTERTMKSDNNLMAPETLKLLDLAADTTPAMVTAKIKDLVDSASKAVALQAELEALKASTNKSTVEDLLDAALEAGKITVVVKKQLAADYEHKPTDLKNLLANMPGQRTVTGQLTAGAEGLPEKFQGKSYRDLYLSGDLESLKSDFPAYFEELKKKEAE